MAIFKPKPVAPKPVMGKPVAPKPVAPTPVAPKPVIGKPVAPKPVVPTPVIGKPVMPGIKPLPPGSIGMPGGPGGKTVYNTGPAPKGGLSGGPIGTTGFKQAPVKGPVGTSPAPIGVGQPSSFYNSVMGGGAAPSRPAGPSLPVTGNKLNTTGFKNIAPVSFDMKKGGKVSSASKRADGIAQRGKTRI